MNKKFGFSLIISLSILAVAVLWLLSHIFKDDLTWFTPSVAIAIVAGVTGLAFLLRGLFSKLPVPLKKMNIFLAAGLFIVCLFMSISAIAWIEDRLVMPIVGIILASAIVLSIVAVGGKKWDSGDNKQAGYKNYHQRKAEEEKNKKDNENKW